VTWYDLPPKEEADMAKKYIVDLERDEQEMLTGLIASGTQRVRKINHARILLKAGAGWTDQKISEALDISVPTIERVPNTLWKKASSGH